MFPIANFILVSFFGCRSSFKIRKIFRITYFLACIEIVWGALNQGDGYSKTNRKPENKTTKKQGF